MPVPSAPVSVRAPPCFSISILTRAHDREKVGRRKLQGQSNSLRRLLQTPCPEQPCDAQRSARAARFDASIVACSIRSSVINKLLSASNIERRTAAQCCAPNAERARRSFPHAALRRELRSSAYSGIYRDRRFRGARHAGRRQRAYLSSHRRAIAPYVIWQVDRLSRCVRSKSAANERSTAVGH